MKKLFTLISFILFTLTVFSQHSIFTIFAEEGEKFSLYVDGELMNETPQSRIANVKIFNEYSNLKIKFDDASIPSIKKNIALKDMDGNFQKMVFKITQNKKGQYKFRTNSFEVYNPEEDSDDDYVEYNLASSDTEEVNNSENVNLNVSVNGNDTQENTSVSMSIDSDDENTSVKIQLSASSSSSSSENVNFSMNVSESSSTTTTYSESSYSESSSYETSNTSSEKCDYAVSNSEFSSIKTNISSKNFDDTKLTTAKDIAKNKCLTSIQIRDIMKILMFEDDRLEFAIYAYDYVYDSENYYEVYSAFDHELTIDELKEKIQ